MEIEKILMIKKENSISVAEIEKILIIKKEMEEKILDIIKEFTAFTKMSVTSIHLDLKYVAGTLSPIVFSVITKVEL